MTVSRLRCIDPVGGAPPSSGHGGGPIQHAVIVEKQDPRIGRIGRVTIADAFADGMSRSAVVIGTAVDGPVRVSASEFRNFAAGIAAAYDKQAILGRSPVVVERTRATPSPKAPPGTLPLH
ncbi:hypothetical protein G7077_01455 [Sphingomonas piscis]|uniref:Uncharacterized protein n=1 Tax=Sphingomonas piscis TaxID=2714943 RepID=A0A6G7YM12_9SPHN|nr:hypothetical protein [Sphingomonas piscis]QIK77778.1 hypothetical protein G7077_01455 [Sphingomonas piscis]